MLSDIGIFVLYVTHARRCEWLPKKQMPALIPIYTHSPAYMLKTYESDSADWPEATTARDPLAQLTEILFVFTYD